MKIKLNEAVGLFIIIFGFVSVSLFSTLWLRTITSPNERLAIDIFNIVYAMAFGWMAIQCFNDELLIREINKDALLVRKFIARFMNEKGSGGTDFKN